MYCLSLDTSGASSSVALVKCDNSAVFEVSGNKPDSHNEELSLLVGDLLSKNAIDPAQISSICVGLGPGSFTGLRIGLAFAKGFAFSRKIPLFGYSTFDAFAWEFRNANSFLATIADARRKEVYCALYSIEGDTMTRLFEPGIFEAERLIERFSTLAKTSNLHLVGEDSILELFPAVKQSAPRHVGRSLAEMSFSRKTGHISRLSDIEPLYVRAVQAKTIEERASEKAQKRAS